MLRQFMSIYRQFMDIFGADACYRCAFADKWLIQMLFKDALTAIVLPISLTPCFGSSLHQIITMFCKTLIVLRTIHRIYLPSVELMMFCRTDYRF